MNPKTAKTPPAQPNLIRAQGAAFRLNKRFAVTQPGELDLEAAAMALGVLVFVGRLDGAAARLVRQGSKGIIRISDRITVSGGQRFAAAHEIGHWEMHGEYSQLFLCTESDMRDYDRSPLEIEANTFASELLMPSVLIRPLCQDADPSLTLVGQRFAAAHEIGHWEMHGEYSQLFLCTESDMRDYDRSPLEIEANTFASISSGL